MSHGIESQECLHLDYIDNDKEILIFAKIKPSQRECVYYHFKDTKIKEYKQKTIKSFASKSLTNVLKKKIVGKFVECSKTWNNYKEYTINSFIKYKDRRLSNGPIEGIKELNVVMSCYRNTKRF